jgi:hypothetical protein
MKGVVLERDTRISHTGGKGPRDDPERKAYVALTPVDGYLSLAVKLAVSIIDDLSGERFPYHEYLPNGDFIDLRAVLDEDGDPQ